MRGNRELTNEYRKRAKESNETRCSKDSEDDTKHMFTDHAE